MRPAKPNRCPPTGVRPFPSTHWSVVLAAGEADSADAREAYSQLCGKYWYPLYAFVRRRGCGPEDAQDLTQEFLVRFLEKRYLAMADPARGRFRSFLLKSLQHFLSDEWDKARALKRGGGRRAGGWDPQEAELRYRSELVDDRTPEKLYEQQWATALLQQAVARLGREYDAAGKTAQFQVLREFLWGPDPSCSYAQLAGRISSTEEGVKTAIRRLRARCRELVRDEIGHTVTTTEELKEEIRWLFGVFA
ncbi:MAG: sigma-70 family RNA polymerase sigma factor [Planctomycetota bacterium]|nr:sigma-70 family RNA polymerase sigma factor [Planctomycetota bacterium]